jgi:glycosyl transferase family 9 (putative heptosyltransferase)
MAMQLSEELARRATEANRLGNDFVRQGRAREADRCYLKALEIAPDWAIPRCNLAQQRLAAGDYELGWPLYESRRFVPNPQARDLNLPIPEWHGEPIAGTRVAVIAEQGLGDQIMFGRYLTILAARGATVTYSCAPPVAALFPCAIPPRRSSIAADYWVFVGSLPLRLGLREPPPPAPIPVPLRSGEGIGVMANSGQTYANDAGRRLSDPAKARLLALGRDLSPEATGATDFLQTAAIIAGLDLVISVDTSVAHLAASMGKPTWILTSHLGADWRWIRGRRDSPWYPSAQLYWFDSNWSALLDDVERDLSAASGP